MPRSRFGKGSTDNMPATFRVLYPTHNSTDQLFIPGNQAEGDNSDSGSMAQRLADCQNLVGTDTNSDNIGVAVQPNTLADW
jgi:hypothetical protein